MTLIIINVLKHNLYLNIPSFLQLSIFMTNHDFFNTSSVTDLLIAASNIGQSVEAVKP